MRSVLSHNISNESFLNHSINNSVERIVYDAETFNISEEIAYQLVDDVRNNAELIHYVSDVVGSLVVRMVHEVYLRNSIVEVKTPNSWWEMLKRDYFPLWYLKRFPVKESTTKIDTKTLLIGEEVIHPHKTIHKFNMPRF